MISETRVVPVVADTAVAALPVLPVQVLPQQPVASVVVPVAVAAPAQADGLRLGGASSKSRAAQFARERQVPYLGICLGMQMACIEAARNA